METGFFGKILWINLSEVTFKEETLPEMMYRQYLGGYGLGIKLIYENTPAKVNPLIPKSIFGFFPGLLTGTAAPFSGRYMVVGKSPLTRTWGYYNSGGIFGPEIKNCGFDAIIVKGTAENPVYVSIIGENKEILDATDLWGLDIIKAEEKLKLKHRKFIKTAGIGQSWRKNIFDFWNCK
ncbi:MAG: aldehyde ferredoxin oxidoreductase N-terminal domain-containing protein [Promethearchaeota archaeon]